MDAWNYLKALRNKKYDYYPRCPYCGELLHILTKSFMVEFKTPKIPPLGANDLNLFDITYKTYLKNYVVCENCKAKYDYDMFAPISTRNALTGIPSFKIMINKFLDNELSNYSINTSYEVIWKKTLHKKLLRKEADSVAHRHQYTSINSLCSKLHYIFQCFGLVTSSHRGFGSESKTFRIYSGENSQEGEPTPAAIRNSPKRGFMK